MEKGSREPTVEEWLDERMEMIVYPPPEEIVEPEALDVPEDRAPAIPWHKSKEWLALSAECKERDGRTCQGCGTTAPPLFAHHRIARADGGEDVLENLITLCGDCHAKAHPQIAAGFFTHRWGRTA